MSAPGVGPIMALALRATIDRTGAVRLLTAVGPHLGLTAGTGTHRARQISWAGISRCGVRTCPQSALYEAAHSLLVRSKKWSSLRAWGMNIANAAAWRVPGCRCGPQTGRPSCIAMWADRPNSASERRLQP